MNLLRPFTFLALVLSLSGCLIGYGSGHPGDVSVSWRFSGLTCADAPQVASVVIRVEGEILANGGVFPCQTPGQVGVVLHDFYPGYYSFSIEGRGSNGAVLYAGNGYFTVNGNTVAFVDLAPVASNTSYAELGWTLPANSTSANPDCEQAGIDFVDVRIDGAPAIRHACSAGFGSSSVQTPYLTAGLHSIELSAVNANGYAYYRFSGSLQTYAAASVYTEYDLDWAVGGAVVAWQLKNGGTTQTCAQAGVQTMAIHFQDAAGNLVYGAEGDVQTCGAAPVEYFYLRPGTYRVFVYGYGTGGVTYLSNTASPPTVTVYAGYWPTTVLTLQLNRADH
jgi:hypothetical protein